MLSPFNDSVWIWILITFGIALIVIQIVNRLSGEIKDFVFGRRVRTPTLNLLIAVMGGSQTILPRRNFGRYLLMLFLLWSLIFRSCYQGKLYKQLQAEDRKPGIQSFEELVEENVWLWEPYFDSYIVGTVDSQQRYRMLIKVRPSFIPYILFSDTIAEAYTSRESPMNVSPKQATHLIRVQLLFPMK